MVSSDADVLLSRDRSQSLIACERPTSALLAVLLNALIIGVVFMIPVDYPITFTTLQFGQTKNFNSLAILMPGLTFSLLLLSSIQGTERLVAQPLATDELKLLSEARKVQLADCLGMAVFFAYTALFVWGEDEPVSMVVVTLLINVFWLSLLLWAATLMRVSILRRERSQISSYLSTLRWVASAIVAIQFLGIISVLMRSFSQGIVMPPRHLPMSEACSLVNSSYLQKFCTCEGLLCTTKVQSITQQNFACNDGHLLGPNFTSAYDVCQAFGSYVLFVSPNQPLLSITQTLPTLPILFELRRGQKWQGRLRSFTKSGDLTTALLVIDLLICLAWLMLGPQNFTNGSDVLIAPSGHLETVLVLSIHFGVGWGVFPLAAMSALAYSSDAMRRGLLRFLGRDAEDTYVCFCSHDWGTDSDGRSTHERVGAIHQALQGFGLSTWYDSNNMHGDINSAMTRGIDSSKCARPSRNAVPNLETNAGVRLIRRRARIRDSQLPHEGCRRRPTRSRRQCVRGVLLQPQSTWC